MHNNGIDETRELRESNKWAFSNITYKITSRTEKHQINCKDNVSTVKMFHQKAQTKTMV